ncbi:MAG: hypothetical protein ACFFDT_14945 [Candidatus Hodarchaeota archaeon]
MPRRICDACGKEKDVKRGKICENGHYICANCVYGGILDPAKTTCSLCERPLK